MPRPHEGARPHMTALLGLALSLSWLHTCAGFAPTPPAAGAGQAHTRACDGLLLRRSFATCSFAPQRGQTASPSLRMSEEGEGLFPLSKSSSLDEALGTNKPEEMFALTDTDGSGGLDFDEFSSVFGGLGMGLGYAEMRELFMEIDLNKDGVISLAEFKTRMEQDFAEARNAATEAGALAEAELQSAGGKADESNARLNDVKKDADAAQKKADDISRAMEKLGF